MATGLGHPVGIVVDSDQEFAYVTEQDSGALSQIELATGSKTILVAGMTAPFFLAWSKDASAVYCVQRDPANRLVSIDLSTLTISTVAGGLSWRPSGVAPLVDDSLIYICADREVEVISWNGTPPIDQPPPPFVVHSVSFGGEEKDSLALKNHISGASIPKPEYILSTRNEPAAYVAGSKPTVRVVLRKLAGFAGGSYAIGATGNFGGIRRKVVTPSFGSSGLSAPIEFEFMWPLPRRVGKPDVHLDWVARRASVPAVPTLVGSDNHRIYLPLAYPVAPWSAPYWVAAFELACEWASGASTLDEAAALVTERYNGSGRVKYDTDSGATFYGLTTFAFSEMLERLTGGMGQGEKVNCTDSADTVSTVSNLLGCELWQSRMGWGFDLNPIIAIGYNVWEIPFWGGFSYHEVAWKDGATAADNVFDGCLKVDGDADPTSAPHTPLLPTNMRFGDCTTMDYRLRLCPPSSSGCGACVPQPGTTRQRRPIT